MEKHPNELKLLRKATIILVLLSILTLTVVAMVPSARASGPSLTLNPSSGASGPYLYVTAQGFGFAVNSQVTISVFNQQLAKVQASSDYGTIATTFLMPNSAPGSYTITATDDQGNSAAAQFLVLGGSGNTPTPATPPPTQSSNPTSAPSGSNPTVAPTFSFATVKPSLTPGAKGEGFWSPLVIGVVIAVVAVAILVPSAFFFMRRGGGKRELPDEAPPAYPSYGPSPPPAGPQYNAPSYGQPVSRTSAPSRYQSSSYSQQLTRPTMTRPGMTSSYGAGAGATRVCPRCRHAVKDYYSVCPYCHNKLK